MKVDTFSVTLVLEKALSQLKLLFALLVRAVFAFHIIHSIQYSRNAKLLWNAVLESHYQIEFNKSYFMMEIWMKG